MRASTRLEVGLDGAGRTVLHRTYCEVPLVVRVDDRPGSVLTLLVVNGAAGPLGGDEFSLSLDVTDGATVRVRSVGASIVQPGSSGQRSFAITTVRVGAGAHLDWELEPTVSVVTSDHRARTDIEAASSATIRLVDTVSLGRHGEASGLLALRQRVTMGGVAVLDHETVFGPGAASGPGAQGSSRVFRSTVIVGDDAPTTAFAAVDAPRVHGVFPLGPRCALVTTAAASMVDLCIDGTLV